MVALTDLPECPPHQCEGYRLVNSKFPPIGLFDDVANEAEFETLYALQALTNPRLRNEIGDLGLVSTREIPFGIRGCSYATAPFTHLNPQGSRFSRGFFGVLYLADSLTTAIAEVSHHQQLYWQNVDSLHFERFIFRGLKCTFDQIGCRDGLGVDISDPIYAKEDYTASQALGEKLHKAKCAGVRYHSVRREKAICWALLTPRHVLDIIQTTHLEMIWNGRVSRVNQLSTPIG